MPQFPNNNNSSDQDDDTIRVIDKITREDVCRLLHTQPDT